MRTSGLLFNIEEDGSASIGYEDYSVEIFGGDDIEVIYRLNQENFETLLKKLGIIDQDIKGRLIDIFGANFNSLKFEGFCKKNNITYSKNVHIG